MATLKEFEDALKAAGNTAALDILEGLRARDRSQRTVRPARRLTGRKMTPELAAEVLHLHQTTSMTQQEIAFQLSVNQGRVNEVIKHRKWLDGDPNAPEAQARDKAKQRAKDGVGFAPRPTPERPKSERPAAKRARPAPAAAPPEPSPTPAVEPAPDPAPVAAPPVVAEPAAPPEPALAPAPSAEPKTKPPPRRSSKRADPSAQFAFKDLL